MIRSFKRFYGLANFLAFLWLMCACIQQRPVLGEPVTVKNLSFTVQPSADSSVSFSYTYNANANSSISHKVIIYNVDNPQNPQIAYSKLSTNPSQSLTEKFENNYKPDQVNKFKAIYYAYGVGGKSDSVVVTFSHFVKSKLDAEVVRKLTANIAKQWRWDKSNSGHLGVGPDNQNTPSWYTAKANEKPNCLYDDVITFSWRDGKVFVKNENQGNTFIHADHQKNLVNTSTDSDECFDYPAGTNETTVSFSEATSGIQSSTKVQINTGNTFLSYALESNSYEILKLTETELYVRTTDKAPDGTIRAWYQRFISESNCISARTSNTAGSGTYQLVWEENFNTDGPICDKNWVYDIGTGSGGWGNDEKQYYTNHPENIKIEGGVLKIIAKKKSFGGADYTSARIKTQGKFEFTYGKVEIRVKNPANQGTWPAAWMLGANFNEVGWPTCGEIDIMEHVGNDNDNIIHAIHNLSSSGNTVNVAKTRITHPNDFHIYSIEWTNQSIIFSIDGTATYTYNPSLKDNANWPFNKPQFILLNLAIGGKLGGTIDANFSEAVYEVDYVKVYQK